MTQLYRIKASVTDEMLEEQGLTPYLRRVFLGRLPMGGDVFTQYGIPKDWMEEVKQTRSPSLDEQKEAMRREIYIRLVSGPLAYEECKDAADRAVQAYYGG